MAEVMVTFRVMPQSPEEDLDRIEREIKSLDPQKLKREPIAFGLVALNLTKLVPDAAGELEKLENRLKSIEGVGQVEVLKITRAL